MSCSVPPSKVLDKQFVSIPPEEEMVGRQGWDECGKWILTCSELDLSFVDSTWAALQPLLADGTLLMLKASTALLGRETAVVQCFVRGGAEEAKRTAGLIRAAVRYYKGIMYYKVNRLTREAVARRHGHKHVSRYMHTYRGRFYGRDPWGDWILEEEENGQRDVSIPRKFRKEYYSGSEELPSTSYKSLLSLPSFSTGEANWHLRCRSFDRHRDYLPECDRVWIVARELLGEGYLTGISCGKNAQGIEVRLYVSAGSSLTSQLDACDRIFGEASVRRIMYFTRGTESKIPYSYKYIPEGELYEQTEFAEKFLLQR